MLWLVWLVWVLVSYLTFTLGESLGKAVEGVLAPEIATLPRALSIKQPVEAGSSLNLFASLVGGLVAGAIFGLGQGIVLLPFLKLRGALAWVAATTIGRAVGWLAVYVLSKEMVRLVLDKNIAIACLLAIFLAGIGVIAGLSLGYAQALVLRRRLPHPTWWVFSNVPGPVVASLLIAATLFIETENIVRDFSTPFIATVTAVATGIVLMDLLRLPTMRAEWMRGIRLRKERPKGPQQDTVLGSTQYGQPKPSQTPVDDGG